MVKSTSPLELVKNRHCGINKTPKWIVLLRIRVYFSYFLIKQHKRSKNITGQFKNINIIVENRFETIHNSFQSVYIFPAAYTRAELAYSGNVYTSAAVEDGCQNWTVRGAREVFRSSTSAASYSCSGLVMNPRESL